jgi:hypothetical protein
MLVTSISLILAETYLHRSSHTGVKIYRAKHDSLPLKQLVLFLSKYTPSKKIMQKSIIRNLVSRVLLIKRLTPELENMINQELAEQGYITDPDYEALEYLMQAVDQGKILQAS